uniref:Uncharacterized protein n=1 Tax=Bionectria ochroleuca TaxID=29856 RepID=A0A8H7KB51_BIOOC
MIPKIEPAVRTWPNRLGAGLIFWCFSRFTTGLKQAKEQSDSAVRAAQTAEPVGSGEVAAVSAVPSTAESTLLAADAFQDIDLSMFLDDFGWNGGMRRSSSVFHEKIYNVFIKEIGVLIL